MTDNTYLASVSSRNPALAALLQRHGAGTQQQQPPSRPPRRLVVIDDDDNDDDAEEEASLAAAAAAAAAPSFYPSSFQRYNAWRGIDDDEEEATIDLTQSPPPPPQQQQQQQPLLPIEFALRSNKEDDEDDDDDDEEEATIDLTQSPPPPPQQQQQQPLLPIEFALRSNKEDDEDDEEEEDLEEVLPPLTQAQADYLASIPRSLVIAALKAHWKESGGEEVWPTYSVMSNPVLGHHFYPPLFQSEKALVSWILLCPGRLKSIQAAKYWGIAHRKSTWIVQREEDVRRRVRFPLSPAQLEILVSQTNIRISRGMKLPKAVSQVIEAFQLRPLGSDDLISKPAAVYYFKRQAVVCTRNDAERFIFWYLIKKVPFFSGGAPPLATPSVKVADWINYGLGQETAADLLPLSSWPVYPRRIKAIVWRDASNITPLSSFRGADDIQELVDNLLLNNPPKLKYEISYYSLLHAEKRHRHKQEAEYLKLLEQAEEIQQKLEKETEVLKQSATTNPNVIKLSSGLVIGVDWVGSQEVVATLDILLFTHPHTDHFSKGATKPVEERMNARTNPLQVICLASMTSLLTTLRENGQGHVLGGTKAFPIHRLVGVEYDEVTELPNGVQIILKDARHCPASSSVLVVDVNGDMHVHTGDVRAGKEYQQDLRKQLEQMKKDNVFTTVKSLVIDDTRLKYSSGPLSMKKKALQCQTRPQIILQAKSLLLHPALQPHVKKGKLLVVLTDYKLSTRITLAAAMADELGTNVFIDGHGGIVHNALISTGYYDNDKLVETGTNQDSLVHIVSPISLYSKNIKQTFIDKERLAQTHGVKAILYLQSAGFYKSPRAFETPFINGKGVHYVVPIHYSDHSNTLEVVQLVALLKEYDLKCGGLQLLTKPASQEGAQELRQQLFNWVLEEEPASNSAVVDRGGGDAVVIGSIRGALLEVISKLECKGTWQQCLAEHKDTIVSCMDAHINANSFLRDCPKFLIDFKEGVKRAQASYKQTKIDKAKKRKAVDVDNEEEEEEEDKEGAAQPSSNPNNEPKRSRYKSSWILLHQELNLGPKQSESESE